MSDIAHTETDKAIKQLEKEIKKVYAQAEKECTEKLLAHMNRYKRIDKQMRDKVAAGKMTQDDYVQWRMGQLAIGERWEEMCKSLATDLANADKIAESISKGYCKDAYALNHNFATFEVEKASLVDTSYTLYDRHTVERLISQKKSILPEARGKTAQALREGKLIRWNMQRITSAVTQGILQGESVYKIASRLQSVVGMDTRASIRNARTAVTGAQNAGRQDGFERAEEMGIKGKKLWIATMDHRTRHWHVELDGEKVDVGDKFHNEYGDIEYPGDVTADPANVYNCRCTMGYVLEGFEDRKQKWFEDRQNPALGNISWEKWKEEHAEAQARKGYVRDEG